MSTAELDDHHCHNCGAYLRYEYPDGTTEHDNALWISMEGGYGQFIDPMVDSFDIREEVTGEQVVIGRPMSAEHQVEYLRRMWKLMEVILCHECAHDLCDKFPAFRNKIDPHNSHSHKTAYVEAHPDHWGWDYDYRDEQ